MGVVAGYLWIDLDRSGFQEPRSVRELCWHPYGGNLRDDTSIFTSPEWPRFLAWSIAISALIALALLISGRMTWLLSLSWIPPVILAAGYSNSRPPRCIRIPASNACDTSLGTTFIVWPALAVGLQLLETAVFLAILAWRRRGDARLWLASAASVVGAFGVVVASIGARWR